MLALVCGNGGLPAAVASAQVAPPLITTMVGHAPDKLAPEITFRIEELGSFLQTLKDRGVVDVCLCGPITRPAIDPAAIDAATAPLVPTLAAAVAGGEDSALRAVLGLFEDAGFNVLGAHDLAPDLLPPAGALTRVSAPDNLDRDLSTAHAMLEEQGRADQGQACVVRGGVVIAYEDTRGTDAMLADLVQKLPRVTPGDDDPFGAAMDMMGDMLDSAADWLSGPVAEQRAVGQGGFLFKAPKPEQDLRVDLPTIGPGTARGVVDAKLDGIVIASGGVIVLEQTEVRDILDTAGCYLWVR